MKLSELAQTVTMKVAPGTRVPREKQDKWQLQSNGYTCTLAYQGRRLTVDFWQGTGISGNPDVAGVLSSLLLDASCGQESFEDFCSNMGLNTDSRSALKTYKVCASMNTKLQRLLGSDYVTFLSAENDV